MNRNTLIALAICFLLFLAWGPLMQRLGWSPPPDAEPPAEQVTDGDDQNVTAPGLDEPAPEEAAADEPALMPDPDGIEKVPVEEQPEAMIQQPRRPADATSSLAMPKFLTVYIDRAHGGILKAQLHKYLSYQEESRVFLGNYRYPFCSVSTPGRLGEGEILENSEERFVLRRDLEQPGVTCTETWELDPEHPYQINYVVTFANASQEPQILSGVALDAGGLAAEQTASAKLGRVGAVDLSIDVALDPNQRPESFQAKDIAKFDAADRRNLAESAPIWVAVHNKYFMFLLASEDGPFDGCRIMSDAIPAAGGEEEEGEEESSEEWLSASVFLPRQMLPAGGEKTFRFTGYAGPKEYERLNRFGRGATNVMRLDLFMLWRASWMGLIARTILKSLIWIRNAIGQEWGYGVAIILVTVVIKFLFWPLTHKSTVSMRRMQQLQPLMQEIREKHRDDQQLMNQKLMELYREHKVNPLGGCLPILFQIPVFFALFNTLRGAIELRQASFLWVADLSMPDTLPWLIFGFPIRPLAIIMGLSMLLQQRLSPASSNPSQTRMMTFMSVFFMFIFYGMPAGLTLYWTVNQLLTIGQNLVTRKLDKQGK